MKPILPGKEVNLSTPLLGSNNCHEAIDEQSHGEGIHTDSSTDNQLLDKGYLQYGCTHVPRRCRIRAPCCNEIFNCERCHDEFKNNLDKDGHKMPYYQNRQVICSLCNTEQEFQQICINCGVCMGRYFCGICKIMSDEPSVTLYHCLSCGACRKSTQERQISHCNKCQCCRVKAHTCIDGTLHRDCPICFEYLIETPGPFASLPCGHILHTHCLLKLNRNTCPFCSETFVMPGRNTTWRLQLPQFLRIFNTNWYFHFHSVAFCSSMLISHTCRYVGQDS